MNRWIGRCAPELYAVMRIVLGFLFACHGAQKLAGVPGDHPKVELVSLIGLAGVIELMGGIMIAVGFMAGWAAFVASGQMAFAYFMAHASKSFWPVLNGGELAVVYCFVFLYMSSRGSGKWSVDQVLGTG